MQDFKARRPRKRRGSGKRRDRGSPEPRGAFPAAQLAPLPIPARRISSRLEGFAGLLSRLRAGRLLTARTAFALGTIWLLGGAVYTVGSVWNAPLSRLEITGHEALTKVQVAAAAGLYPGIPVGGLDPLATAERLMAHARVKQASVRRMIPGALAIDLRERRPAALAVLADGSTAMLDREGIVLEVGLSAVQAAASGLPTVKTAAAPAMRGARMKGTALTEGLRLSERARRLAPDAGRLIVDATDAFSVRVHLPEQGRTVILPMESAEQTLETYFAIEPVLERSVPGFRTADLRAAQRKGVGWVALRR